MKATKGKPVAVAILWSDGPVRGKLEIAHGSLDRAEVVSGSGHAADDAFTIQGSSPARLEIRIAGARTRPGAYATRVTVRTDRDSFTFFLRDVTSEWPIFLPDFGVAVTTADDPRPYDAIADAIRARAAVSIAQRIEDEPEETYENACRHTREQTSPTWLGLSRDMRIFRIGHHELGGYWGYVQPCYHTFRQTLPELGDGPVYINFAVGPGESCRVNLMRRLEEGVLPILRSTQVEDDITYELTAFATLETQPLNSENLRGSDWRAAYPNTGGHMLSKQDLEDLSDLLHAEMKNREEEVVCCIRIEAVNTGSIPRYAWFKAPVIDTGKDSHGMTPAEASSFDGETGFGRIGTDRVYAVNRLNGEPLSELESAVLVAPGQSVVLEMLIPHLPISSERARVLARLDFDEHLDACRTFWRDKLTSAAGMSVPEPAIDERIRAGLLHCDINTLGRADEGPLLATIGWYSPLGSESSAIIQFFDSMGWHDVARRCLDFFLERQRDDGFIQNFGGYQSETGPALWSMGEHYRYTRDDRWVARIKPKLLKSCRFLLDWRERNKTEKLRGRGFGMLDGKVADPQDFYHAFILNGYSYLGIARAAEMLRNVDPDQSRRLADEADAFREDIRTSFLESLITSPVVPTGDGTWTPTYAPWPEYPGPVALYAEGGTWWTHGAFGARDALVGASSLVFAEVFAPDEPAAGTILKANRELFTTRNVCPSQPCGCRYDYIHLKLGEVKAFLKTYYNQMTGLQDRQTYAFWEHYHHASQYKTHEEACFLMQTRWMLYLEEGDRLAFLRAVPRRWLEVGKSIRLDNVATYFGPASLLAESHLDEGFIRATMTCPAERRPSEVTIRLPHPDGKSAHAVEGGTYDPATETVRITPFDGRADVVLRFRARP